MSDTPGAAPARSLVTKIVSGYVSKNQIVPADMPTLIATVHQSLLSLGKSTEPEPNRSPAVPIRRSVSPNYVVCLAGEDATSASPVRHGLSANQYRVQWKLSPDHPITARAYSERRSAFARQIGLGQKPIGRRRRRQAPQRPPT